MKKSSLSSLYGCVVKYTFDGPKSSKLMCAWIGVAVYALFPGTGTNLAQVRQKFNDYTTYNKDKVLMYFTHTA
jgi:hypothetical protein